MTVCSPRRSSRLRRLGVFVGGSTWNCWGNRDCDGDGNLVPERARRHSIPRPRDKLGADDQRNGRGANASTCRRRSASKLSIDSRRARRRKLCSCDLMAAGLPFALLEAIGLCICSGRPTLTLSWPLRRQPRQHPSGAQLARAHDAHDMFPRPAVAMKPSGRPGPLAKAARGSMMLWARSGGSHVRLASPPRGCALSGRLDRELPG